jgi:molecular chaperone DnaK (HSP70)
LPSSSISSSPLELDWKEGVEVSKSIADDALVMLEGLGLLSEEYGIMDYLRGHYPDIANQRDQTFIIKYPKPDPKTDSKIDETIDAASSSALNLDKSDSKSGIEGNLAIQHNEGDSDNEISVVIPTDEESYGLLVTNPDNEQQQTVKNLLETLGKNVPQTHQLSFLSALRAIDGLKSSSTQQNRLRVISLRLGLDVKVKG